MLSIHERYRLPFNYTVCNLVPGERYPLQAIVLRVSDVIYLESRVPTDAFVTGQSRLPQRILFSILKMGLGTTFLTVLMSSPPMIRLRPLGQKCYLVRDKGSLLVKQKFSLGCST